MFFLTDFAMPCRRTCAPGPAPLPGVEMVDYNILGNGKDWWFSRWNRHEVRPGALCG